MCVNPRKGFKIPGAKSKNGKDVYIWKSIDTDCVEWNKKILTEYIEIPCGKCIECRLSHAQEWSIRCCAEASLYPDNYNYFLTLTYNTEHLPMCNWTDPITQEYIGYLPTLQKKDVQDFLKRLRRYFSYHFGHEGIRYFYCGEYGPTTGRPHYHMILFNCPLHLLPGFPSPDNYFEVSEQGYPYYKCEKLDDIWKNGFVIFSPNNAQTSAYTARYCTKKKDLPGETFLAQLNYRYKKEPAKYANFYHQVITYKHYQKVIKEKLKTETNKDEIQRLKEEYVLYNWKPPEGQQREFTEASRDPGLGSVYFDQNYEDLYSIDECWITGKKTKIPRYFDILLERKYPDLYESVKEDRYRRGQMKQKNRDLDGNIRNGKDLKNFYQYKRQIAEDKHKQFGYFRSDL